MNPAGRLPAHDLDAEAVVLSAVLDAPDGLDRVIDVLRPEHFYADANGEIYAAALDVRATTAAPPSLLGVTALLRDRGRLQAVGGAQYVAQLALETPYVTDLDGVARRIRDKHRVRRMVAECQRIAAEGYGDVGDVDDWIGTSEAAIHTISEDRADEHITTMREALVRVFSALSAPDTRPGLSTGLPDLDRILGPMRPGQLVLIGALSGIGKSALALLVALHATLAAGEAVVIFSAEMEADELATRALFSDARVDSSKVNSSHRLRSVDFSRITASAAHVGKVSMWIDDRASMSPAQIRSRVRRLQSQCSRRGSKLGLVVVDYIQLLDGKAGLPKNASRENEVAEIARALKVLAKESGIPVLALAQLNSDSEKAPRGGRKPRLNDLRESKALAQNADKVILIHNPAAIDRAEAYRQGRASGGDLPAENVDLIVAKNRGGMTGTVQALFWPSYTLFESSPVQAGAGSDEYDQHDEAAQ